MSCPIGYQVHAEQEDAEGVDPSNHGTQSRGMKAGVFEGIDWNPLINRDVLLPTLKPVLERFSSTLFLRYQHKLNKYHQPQ
ncbi:MAG: hypothetical protein ACFFCW_42035 [Candidatus Hodarchaeota archaeon]